MDAPDSVRVKALSVAMVDNHLVFVRSSCLTTATPPDRPPRANLVAVPPP